MLEEIGYITTKRLIDFLSAFCTAFHFKFANSRSNAKQHCIAIRKVIAVYDSFYE